MIKSIQNGYNIVIVNIFFHCTRFQFITASQKKTLQENDISARLIFMLKNENLEYQIFSIVIMYFLFYGSFFKNYKTWIGSLDSF